MKAITQGIERFISEEDGVTMVEYGLIAALISIVCLVALTAIGTQLDLTYDKICGALKSAVSGTPGSTC